MSGGSARRQLRIRWAASLLLGVVVAIPAALSFGTAVGIVAGWAALALASTVWVLLQIWPMDGAATRAHATAEDPGRKTARLIAVVGSVVSLGAVGVVMAQAQHADGPGAYWLAGIAVVSVVASWALIQTDYLLHYAHVYYAQDDSGEPQRGIDFNEAEDPSYTDFAYFSVGLGMTYQVADTDVRSNAIRRIVIAQTMLAYLFGAGIIGTVINLVTSLG